jgi:hypothetical protein
MAHGLRGMAIYGKLNVYTARFCVTGSVIPELQLLPVTERH